MPAIIAQISAAGPHLFAAVRLSLWCVALVMTWTAIERLRDAYTLRALPAGNSAVRLQGEQAVAADALRLGAMVIFAFSVAIIQRFTVYLGSDRYPVMGVISLWLLFWIVARLLRRISYRPKVTDRVITGLTVMAHGVTFWQAIH